MLRKLIASFVGFQIQPVAIGLRGVSVFTSTSMTLADGLLAGMYRVEVAAGWKRPAWSGGVPGPNKILHTIQVVQIH